MQDNVKECKKLMKDMDLEDIKTMMAHVFKRHTEEIRKWDKEMYGL